MFVDNVYIKSEVNGKFIKVVFVASSDEQANHFMETNPDFGVILGIATGPTIFIAHNEDLGE